MQQVLQAACCTPGRSKPQVVLVGATLGPSIESSALQMVRRWTVMCCRVLSCSCPETSSIAWSGRLALGVRGVCEGGKQLL